MGENKYGDPTKEQFFYASLYYAPPDSFARFTVQALAAYDVDGDNKQELIVAKDDANTTREDVYIIYSLDGTEVNDPFATLKTEFYISPRAGYGSGSPWTFAVADLDGDGKKEIVFNSYNYQNVFILLSRSIPPATKRGTKNCSFLRTRFTLIPRESIT